MQTATAVVRSVKDSMAEIEISSSGCGRCSEPGGCGGQNLSRAFCGAPKRFWIVNSLGATTGESVRIAIDASRVRRAATVAYLVPLVALLTGALLGSIFGSLGSVICGIGMLSMAWYRLVFRNKYEQIGPRLIERLSKPG